MPLALLLSLPATHASMVPGIDTSIAGRMTAFLPKIEKIIFNSTHTMTEQLFGNNGAFVIALGTTVFLIGLLALLIGYIWKKIDWRSDAPEVFIIAGWVMSVLGFLLAAIFAGTSAITYYLTQLL